MSVWSRWQVEAPGHREREKGERERERCHMAEKFNYTAIIQVCVYLYPQDMLIHSVCIERTYNWLTHTSWGDVVVTKGEGIWQQCEKSSPYVSVVEEGEEEERREEGQGEGRQQKGYVERSERTMFDRTCVWAANISSGWWNLLG